MPVVESTRPATDVTVQVFNNLYPVGRARWFTTLLQTSDPGPSPGERTVYGDLASLAQDYPEHSVTYKWAEQYFGQLPQPRELWVLPMAPAADGGPPATADWSAALNDFIAANGVSFYHAAITEGNEAVVGEWADAADANEIIAHIRSCAGNHATVATGTGATLVTWYARKEGTRGNLNTVTYVKSGFSTPFGIEMTENDAGGYDIVVTLQTGADPGDVLTTPTDIEEAVAEDPELSFLVWCEGATGSTVVAAVAKTSFTGGDVGASTIDSFGTLLASLQNRVVFGTHDKDQMAYFTDAVSAGIFVTRNPGSFTAQFRPTQEIRNPFFSPTEQTDMREANINHVVALPTGQLVLSGDWASDGSYIDVAMASHVLAHWQRMELFDLLANPPAGYQKVPYDNDGFAMIQHVIVGTLTRGARREWNFIVSRAGKPAVRVLCPTFEETDEVDRKNRIYRVFWEATFKGAVHEIPVNGYLTVEFIPPTEQRLGERVGQYE